MTMAYSLKVVGVNMNARTMEVLYTAEGYPDKLISMPMPVGNQTAESVIQSYAPTAQWIAEAAPVVDVQVGVSGTVVPTPVNTAAATNVVVNRVTL